jgi:Ca-activated chloride channel homolog
MRTKTLLVSLVAVAIPLAVRAQAPAVPSTPPPSAPTVESVTDEPLFRSGVTEVLVPVTVTDERGRFVSDLSQKDFEVFDQGFKQKIKFFTAEHNQPVVVGFVMDLSNRMKTRWKEFHETAVEMVLSLLPGDARYQGYLIGSSTEAEVLVNTTREADKIVAKLDKLTPAGGSALYDAIYLACTSRKLVPGEPVEPRRVLVIVGDGHDNNSSHTLEEVIELAQRTQLTIFAISTDAYGFTAAEGKNLRRLAEETGGRVEAPLETTYDNTQGDLSRPSDEGAFEFKVGTGGYQARILGSLFRSIQAIAGEISTQYLLRYQPNTPGVMAEKHEIEVKVNLPNAKVRARPAYHITP